MSKILDLLGSIFEWIFDMLVAPFEAVIPDIKDLIFGIGEDGQRLLYGTFKTEDYDLVIVPGTTAFYVLAGGAVLISIVLAGMKISAAPSNPANRTYAFEFIKDLLVVGLLLANLGTIYSLVFGLNQIAIDLVVSGFSANTDLTSLEDIDEVIDNETGVIGRLFIKVVLLFLGIWAFFYYTMRKFTLVILMMVGPLMAAFYLNPNTKHITFEWLKEFAGTTLVQAVHVATFYIISLLSISSGNFLEQIFFFIIFIPVGEMIKSLLGLQANSQGKIGTFTKMSGLAAGAALYGIAKGAIKNKSSMQSLNELRHGKSDNQTTQKTNDSNEQNSMADQTQRASRMMKAGNIASRVGRVALGTLGAVGGMALGPAGAFAGAMAGDKVGSGLGTVVGRGGYALGQGIGRVGKGIGSSFVSAGHDANLKNKVGYEKAFHTVSKGIRGLGKHIKDEFDPARQIQSLSNLRDSDIRKNPHLSGLVKQRRMENIAGYAGGLIAGQKGYQWATNKVANRAIQKGSLSGLKTPTQMVSLARKIDGQVAPNAIQMVVAKDDSYIQVTDSNHNRHVVSKIGYGDPTLAEGQVRTTDISGQIQRLANSPTNIKVQSNMIKSGEYVVNKRNQQRRLNDLNRTTNIF